ncbi:MAG: hypothetical protein JKY33_08285 [Bacteroidia bacterium]|nr:hypothetical protein [Bacteroidia bacterium]
MRHFLILIFNIVITLNLSAQDANVGFVRSDFINCWKHSYEEETVNSEYKIYRPCGYKEFPASRYRRFFDFKANGNCSWFVLAPNDAHYKVDGEWEFHKERNIIEVKNSDAKIIFTIEVHKLQEDLLKIRYLSSKN